MEDRSPSPTIGSLVNGFVRAGLGALRTRGELFSVEWQEEKARLARLMVWTFALGFLVVMTALMLTTTILLLVPGQYRVYAAAGFTVLYGIGALTGWARLKKSLEHEPFSESLSQIKKDKEWLDSVS
jgi:uncharacterized membrane protein YqjE